MGRSVRKRGKAQHEDSPDAASLSSRLTGGLLRRLPGGDYAQRQLDRLENRVLSEIKQRMDGLGEPPSVSVLAVSVASEAPADELPRLPGDLLRRLLERSAEQTPEQAEAALMVAVLRQLVPDEARVLAALSDGSTYPLIHVVSSARLGGGAQVVVEGVCSVGKNAGVQCPQLTPLYVQRLRQLGLVEVDPLEGEDAVRYQLLETEEVVRQAMAQIKQRGRRGQIVRRTLKMSAFGTRLWEACRLSEE